MQYDNMQYKENGQHLYNVKNDINEWKREE